MSATSAFWASIRAARSGIRSPSAELRARTLPWAPSSVRPCRRHEVAETIERLLEVYVERRDPEERFLDTVRRLGVKPFKERCLCRAACCVTRRSRSMSGATLPKPRPRRRAADRDHGTVAARTRYLAGTRHAARGRALACARVEQIAADLRALQPDRRGILRARRRTQATRKRGSCASGGHSAESCVRPATCAATSCFSWRVAASIASNCRIPTSRTPARHSRPSPPPTSLPTTWGSPVNSALRDIAQRNAPDLSRSGRFLPAFPVFPLRARACAADAAPTAR